jgi:hypothetical protein
MPFDNNIKIFAMAKTKKKDEKFTFDLKNLKLICENPGKELKKLIRLSVVLLVLVGVIFAVAICILANKSVVAATAVSGIGITPLLLSLFKKKSTDNAP